MDQEKDYGQIVSVRIGNEVKKALEERAQVENRTVGGQIRHIIDQWLKPIPEEDKK